MDDHAEYPRKLILVGGGSLIVGSIVFVWVYTWLASHFGYPEVTTMAASDMLVKLYVGGPTMRGVWFVYAILPLALIPGAAASYGALRHKLPGAMLVALIFGTIAAIANSAGLMRWSSINYALGAALPSAGPEVRASLEATYRGVDSYLGAFIGDFIGEMSFSVWFLLAGMAMVRDERFPNWIGRTSVVCALSFIVGGFRNAFASGVIDVIAVVNAFLFPLWLILFGVTLIAFGARKP